jgi:hypothetical protein
VFALTRNLHLQRMANFSVQSRFVGAVRSVLQTSMIAPLVYACTCVGLGGGFYLNMHTWLHVGQTDYCFVIACGFRDKVILCVCVYVCPVGLCVHPGMQLCACVGELPTSMSST